METSPVQFIQEQNTLGISVTRTLRIRTTIEAVDSKAVVAAVEDTSMVANEVVIVTTNNIININTTTTIITTINNNLTVLHRTHTQVIQAIPLYIVTVWLMDCRLLLLSGTIETITKETIIKVAVSEMKVSMIPIIGALKVKTTSFITNKQIQTLVLNQIQIWIPIQGIYYVIPKNNLIEQLILLLSFRKPMSIMMHSMV